MVASDSLPPVPPALTDTQSTELVRAIGAVVRENTPAGLARAAVEATCLLAPCDGAAFYIVSGEGIQRLAANPARADGLEWDTAVLQPWEPLHRLQAEPHTMVVQALASDSVWSTLGPSFPDAARVRHCLILPLALSGRVIGVLCAGYYHAMPDPDRQGLLEQFAETVAQLLRTVLLVAESAAGARFAMLRIGLARHAWEAPDSDSLLQDVCTGVATALGISGCAVYLEQGGVLARAAVHPEAQPDVFDHRREVPLLPLLAHVVSTGQAVQVQDVSVDVGLPEVVRAVHESLLAVQVRSLLIVPLRREDRVQGALVLIAVQWPHSWEPGELVLVEQVAEDSARALARQERLRALQRQVADRDAERAQFAKAFDELPVGIVVADHTASTYAWWNQAAEAFAALPSDLTGSGTGPHLQITVRRPDGEPYAANGWPLVRAFRTGVAVPPEELLVQDAEGGMLPVLVAASPLRGARGQVHGALATIVDLTEWISGSHQQRRLSEAREAAMREERERLAREIHDVLAQTITSIVMVLDAVGRATPQDAPTFSRLEQARALARSAVAETRRLAWSLRTATVDLELPPAIVEAELAKLRQRMDLRPDVSIAGEERRVAPEIGSLLQRVLRVVIDNIVVHTQATVVRVVLTYHPDMLVVRVEDDGRGFDPQGITLHGGSMTGLGGVAERTRQLGGTLNVESSVGGGTRVQVELPFTPTSAGRAGQMPHRPEPTPETTEDGVARIRTVIIDDHTMVREGLIHMLQDQPDLEVVGEAATGSDGLRLITELQPDVVLCDLQLPDLSGTEVISRVHAHFPEIRCLVVTTYDSDEFIYESMKAGAKGYVLKDVSAQELGDAVRAAARNESLLQPVVARKLVERFGELARQGGLVEPLTEREIEVLRSVASGQRNKEIAFELGLSESTIKTHLASIFGKLSVTTRTEAVARGRELGIIAL